MREILFSTEQWDFDHNPDGEFLQTVVFWKEDDGTMYLSSIPSRTVDLDSLLPTDPVPRSHFTAPWRPWLTEAPSPPPPGTYIKTPHLVHYVTYRAELGDLLLQEATVFETYFKGNPHPNICAYYGCVREGETITALCLKRYKCTLSDAVEQNRALDRGRVMQDIRAAVAYIHSLGLVHGDINPENIMMDEEDRPVIIDFDACRKVGERLDKCGTTPWCLENIEIARRENDDYSVDLIAKYLDGVDVEGGAHVVGDADVATPASVDTEAAAEDEKAAQVSAFGASAIDMVCSFVTNSSRLLW
ncbi:hypothetical protein PLICRDRAFT_34691 [Plicaturopsis crispa FD-325 SS-3]|nr:hypothetical protein PLICRDRAFT_34691 [Plicaturopsis crispa FD-325 SS-3]